MKKIAKQISTGLIAGTFVLLVKIILSQLFAYVYPPIKTEMQNSSVFRVDGDILLSLFFVEPFITSFVLVFIWNRIKSSLKGHDLKNGLDFGFATWLLMLPGMILSYGSFPISFATVLSWSITGLAGALIYGIIFSKGLK